MNEQELYTLLATTGLEVAYDHFKTPDKTPPFILYRSTDVNAFKADDKTYYKQNNYVVDLITELKDPTTEASLEAILEANNIAYDKECDFLEDERIYQTRYFL